MVHHWVNIADRNDIVAAEPDLTPLFGPTAPPGAVLEGDYTVENGAKPHKADFYLTKAQVGRPIGAMLSGTSGVPARGTAPIALDPTTPRPVSAF